MEPNLGVSKESKHHTYQNSLAGVQLLLLFSTYHLYPILGEHHNALLMKHGYDSTKIPSKELEKIQNLALPNYFV